ncbi:MAG: phosphate acyltransferase PlsX [Planctomycetes bacterium]|nr:phosphate acyltransferase PlsX [Planctomycetota bacterium]MBI3833047.1 phosphate acyltransferase PlsX [Planctomycetota bacterium]
MSVRVAVDAMGGDHAPSAIVNGAVQALKQDADLELILVGDERSVHHELGGLDIGKDASRIRVVHASQIIGMDEAPVEAIKAKRDSSILRMADMGANGEADAILSAGNTGACAAAAQLKLKPLPCVSRPGIAVTIPAFHGPFVLCDVGANIQAKPKHLYEYAVMASLYAERVVGLKNPRVAVMSIGEESGKGTGLVRQTHELLAADKRLNFVGNAEGRDLFANHCDVAVCDGFVGNIILKFVEGLAEGLFKTIAREFEDEPTELRGKFIGALDRVWLRHDYSQYGGAPLLGVNGVCIICHGRSNDVAVRSAVLAACRYVRQDFRDAIARWLA